MLVPQWEVDVAYFIEAGIITLLAITVFLRFLKWRHLEGKAKSLVQQSMKDAKAKFFQVRITTDEDEPIVLDQLAKEREQDNVARDGGVENTVGSSNSSVNTDSAVTEKPVTQDDLDAQARYAGIEPVPTPAPKPTPTPAKDSAEIRVGGKPNLVSTPTKPSQLPPSRTAPESSLARRIRRERELREKTNAIQ